jgi:VCBS repeat-containing protein
VNQPPVAQDDAYSTPEDTALVVGAPGVLANDTDPEGDPVSALLLEPPSHGSVSLNLNGSFTYTPVAQFSGGDTFTYVPLAVGGTGEPGTVSITVAPVNDAPVGVADSYALPKKTDLVVGAPGVLANDTDIDGASLTAVLVTGPTNGTLTLQPDGSFVYDPDANNPVADSFTYRPFDGTSLGNVVTVTLGGSRGRPPR